MKNPKALPDALHRRRGSELPQRGGGVDLLHRTSGDTKNQFRKIKLQDQAHRWRVNLRFSRSFQRKAASTSGMGQSSLDVESPIQPGPERIVQPHRSRARTGPGRVHARDQGASEKSQRRRYYWRGRSTSARIFSALVRLSCFDFAEQLESTPKKRAADGIRHSLAAFREESSGAVVMMTTTKPSSSLRRLRCCPRYLS